MRATLAHGRAKLPFNSSNVAVTSGGTNSTNRTLYLAIQGENPAGVNLLSDIVGPISVNSGQQLQVTIPALARKAGEWWTSFVISASLSNVPTSFVQIAKLPGYTQGGDLTSLPSSITFSSNEDFGLSTTVAAPNNLPTAPLNGALRGITSLGKVFVYNQNSNDTVNNTTVLNGPSSVGRWLENGSVFTTYIDSIASSGGCGQDIANIGNNIKPPKYNPNGSPGVVQRYWLINDSSAYERMGRRIGIAVTLDDEPKTALFNALLKVKFLGYSDTVTGELRTIDGDNEQFDLLNQEVSFQARKSQLIFPDDLQPLEAYAFDIYPVFSQSSLRKVAVKGSLVKLNPFPYEEAGEYSEAGEVTGDLIYPRGYRRLIVPAIGLQVKALKGSGMVDSVSFIDVGETTVSNLAANTANQNILIDGNGAVSTGTADETETIRAKVSTVNGVGTASSFSSTLTITANQIIAVTCTYPSTSDGVGTIRSDYPDTKIANNNKGKFNPTAVVMYVKRLSDNTIRKFTGFAVIPGVSQVFTLPNWSTGTPTNSIPAAPNDKFGLFAASTPAAAVTAGAGDFTAGGYQVCVAFEYNNTVTAISHDEADGCILTLYTPLSELFLRAAYWGKAVSSVTSLRGISSLDISPGQHTKVVGGNTYFYDPTSSLTDDGVIVVKPTNIDAGDSGRWLSLLSVAGLDSAVVLSNISALASLTVTQATQLKVRSVLSGADSNPVWYAYITTSTTSADSDTVVIPSSNPTSGRWHKVGGSGSGGGGSLAVENINALQALNSSQRASSNTVAVLSGFNSRPAWYAYFPDSAEIDDGNLIVLPNDLANSGDDGRWYKIVESQTTVASTTALSAITPYERGLNNLVGVVSDNGSFSPTLYFYEPNSSEQDDANNIITPDIGSGRWHKIIAQAEGSSLLIGSDNDLSNFTSTTSESMGFRVVKEQQIADLTTLYPAPALYAYLEASTEDEDGDGEIVKPNDNPTVGRWHRLTTNLSHELVLPDISALSNLVDIRRQKLPLRMVQSDFTGNPSWYSYNPSSTAASDGDTVVMPGDEPSAGRWIKF